MTQVKGALKAKKSRFYSKCRRKLLLVLNGGRGGELWLGLYDPPGYWVANRMQLAVDMGLIPSQGTRIPHTMRACCHFSPVRLFATYGLLSPGPLSKGFSRQEYWSGLPCPPPGNLPYLRIEPTSLKSPASAGGFFTASSTWEAFSRIMQHSQYTKNKKEGKEKSKKLGGQLGGCCSS